MLGPRRAARAASTAGIDVVGAAAHRARRHRPRRLHRRDRRAAPGRRHQLRRLDRRRRRRGARAGRAGGQRRRRRATSRARPRRPARASCTSRPTTSSTATATRPYVESDPAGAARRLRPHQARRRARVAAALPAGRDRAHGVAVRRRRAELRRHDAAPGRRARRGHASSTTRSAAHLDRPSRAGAARARSSRVAAGVFHVAGGGSCSWYDFAREIFARPASTAGCAGHHRRARPPRPAPGLLVLGTERDGAPRLPDWQRGPGRLPGRARRGAGMRLLVCGGAGFIGSDFVRLRVRDHGDEVVVLDKLTYAGREENLRDVADDDRASCTAPSRTRRPWPAPSRAATRSSTSPPRPTSTARSPSPTSSSARTCTAPRRCWRPRASTGCASSRSPPTRSTARSTTARSPRPRRWIPRRPTRPPRPGADLLVASYCAHLRPAGR